MNPKTVAATMPTMVPMVGTLGVVFEELTHTQALLRLPDNPAYHNHIGGPHAGAMYTLAETASGALVLANFGDLLAECTPLALHGEIEYRKVAMGELWASAEFTGSAEEMIATVRAGERPEFAVAVSLFTLQPGEAGQEERRITGEANFVWTLRPQRRS
ncbi:MAG: DUF4442 domain-containing protein [Candidatus Nanopelagicales bacterium]